MRASYQSIDRVTIGAAKASEKDPSDHDKPRRTWIIMVGCVLGIAGITNLTKQWRSSAVRAEALIELNYGPNKTDTIDEGEDTHTDASAATDLNMHSYHPTDDDATNQTKQLLHSLAGLQAADGIGFGHHYDNYIGQEFWAPKGIMNKSDVHSATGQYPLFFGYDLYQYMNGKNWTRYARWAHHDGAAIVVSWWAINPVNDGEAHDCTGTPITALMPGGSAHHAWLDQLNKVVQFFNKFVDVDGEQIPVIFRLFREANTDHWWWGKRCSTAKEYHAAFKFTYDYIQSRAHNILWAYSPCQVADDVDSALDTWYPGNHIVDVIAADRYSSEEEKLAKEMVLDCEILTEYGRKYKKVVAFGEFGILDGIQDLDSESFFHKTLMKAATGCLQNMSFVSMWANYSPEKYWTPLAGEKNVDGFREFADSRASIFMKDDRWRKLPYYKSIESALGKFDKMTNSPMD